MFQKSHQAGFGSEEVQNDKKHQGLSAFLQNAGYQTLTPLQEKIIPLILSGADLLVETYGARGRTGAFLIPLLLQDDSKQSKSLIVASSPSEVRKIERQFQRFAGSSSKSISIAALGYDTNIKRELKNSSFHLTSLSEHQRGLLTIHAEESWLSSVVKVIAAIAEGV